MGVCVIAIGCTITLGALGICCAIGLGTCAIEHLNSCGIAHGLCGIALNAAAMCGICIVPDVRQMSTGRRHLLQHLVRDHCFFLRRLMFVLNVRRLIHRHLVRTHSRDARASRTAARRAEGKVH